MAGSPLFGPRLTSAYTSPSALRQAAYAQQLIGNAGDTSPTDMWGGIARVGQGLIGGYFANQATGKERAYQEALAAALGSENPLDALKTAAANNPDLAPAATQFTMQNFAQKQNLANALELEEAKRAGEPPKSRTIKRNGVEVTQEWDPATKSYRDIAESAPDWLNPAYVAVQKDIRSAGAPKVSVDVKGETKGMEAAFKNTADQWSDITKQAQNVGRNRVIYDTMRQALPAFRTGSTAEARLAAQKFLEDIGIKTQGVSEAEVLQSAARRLEMAATPKGQGSITENERVLIREQIPRLTSTPEGFMKTLDLMEKLDAYDLKVAQIYNDSARKNGGVPNPLEVNEALAKLGTPLDARDMSLLQGGQATPQAQVQPGSAPANIPAPPPGFQVVQ